MSGGGGECGEAWGAGGVGGHLLLAEELSDVELWVQRGVGGSPWRFPAHRLVLRAQSEVFARMLQMDCTEKESGQVHIADLRPKAVQMMLGYMYCGRADLENWQDALELLRAAHKYQVEPLVQHCARYLESALDLANVCALLEAAALYALPQLRERSAALAADAGFEVLRSAGFARLPRACAAELLAHPELNVDNELVVYRALRRWASAQRCRAGLPLSEEGLMEEMAPFLRHMRCDDMSDTEKGEVPARVLQAGPPGGRRRRPPALLQQQHARSFAFCAEGALPPEGCADGVACARFSLDAPRSLLGLRLALLLPPGAEPPASLPLSLGRGGALLSANLSSAPRSEGPPCGGRRRLEAHLQLRSPWRLEPRAPYRLSLSDHSQSVLLPRTRLLQSSLLTHSGRVNLSLHSEYTLGLTALIII